MNTDQFFYSLDDARVEIAKRFSDENLKNKVKDSLGDKLISSLENGPCSFYFNCLTAPDHAFDFFESASNYIGVKPVVLNYIEDKFVSSNEEKKALVHIRVKKDDEKYYYFKISSTRLEFGKKISEVNIFDGTFLVDFYKKLFSVFQPSFSFCDYSEWFLKNKPTVEYYKLLMEHAVCFGVFFVSVDGDNESENCFTKDVIVPAIEYVQERYGLKPVLVRPYPKDQSDNEDNYWFSFNRGINDYLIQYAQKNNLELFPL